MQSTSIRRVLLAACLAAVAAVALGTVRLERETKRRVDELRSAGDVPAERTYQSDVADALPTPVRRYFETVLEDGQPHVRSVRLEQEGALRLGGRTGSWKPMTATQHYTVDPPGFIWDADVTILPLLSVRVVDAYEFGRGFLRAMLVSTIPVAASEPGPEMDEGELLRYLGEAVWFPTALLPDAGVEWEPIDDRSARATIEDRGTTASLVFHFDDDALVERVIATERYRQEEDDFAPWTGYFEKYRRHDGIQVPTEAFVEWNPPDGDFPYWRANVTSIEYHY
ncbi:DUF6920 family protein [Haloarcula sediminis]|uniref:DUF6920 family protein n=1 Tax=Haloarcula sediminis TaxID=3111777 RepID=UPI002D7815C3|nr:DUF6544 family protein [Haloarcula sp. CK38]